MRQITEAGLHRIAEKSPIRRVRFAGPATLEPLSPQWIIDGAVPVWQLSRELIVPNERFDVFRIPLVHVENPQGNHLYTNEGIARLREEVASGAALFVHGERVGTYAIGKTQFPLSFFTFDFNSDERYKGTIIADGGSTYAFDVGSNLQKNVVTRLQR